MKVNALLAVLLAAVTIAEAQDQAYWVQGEGLVRMLSDRPWISLGPNNRWIINQPPHMGMELETDTDPKIVQDGDEDISTSDDDEKMGMAPDKRSAVGTALNAGRRRRQPLPALGVLYDVGTFFDSLRDNLATLASLSPQQRAALLQAPSPGMSGGGSGMRRLHALRPLRPTGYIRSHNRRSFVNAGNGYPRANHYDPGLLWTGLGRR